VNYPFLTQYERDNETGLDYATARYYSSAQGRFTGVDPLAARARAQDPASWNRYVYAANNPTRFIDPTGQFTDDYYTSNDGTISVYETQDPVYFS
jgi:RHS repeat-associated protein